MSLDEWPSASSARSTTRSPGPGSSSRASPHEQLTTDIHCVTKWSKLDTAWSGVSVDVLLEGIDTAAQHALVHSYGGYTTNLPPRT